MPSLSLFQYYRRSQQAVAKPFTSLRQRLPTVSEPASNVKPRGLAVRRCYSSTASAAAEKNVSLGYLGVLEHVLVAAPLPAEVVSLWVVAVAGAAGAKRLRAAAVGAGAVVLQHVLWQGSRQGGGAHA
jgi:hypothetical protein